MKKYFINLYKELKERLDIKKSVLLFNGIIYLLVALIAYFFDFNVTKLTVLYLFPLVMVIFSIQYVSNANEYKKLDMRYWIAYCVGAIILLGCVTYLMFNIITTKALFILYLGIFIILNNLIAFFSTKKINLIEIIKLGLSTALGILLIIFHLDIIPTYYLFLILFVAVSGLVNIIEFVLIKLFEKKKLI